MSPPPEINWLVGFLFLGNVELLSKQRPLTEAKEGFMSQTLSEVLAANARYAAEFGEKAKLGLPPARRFAVLTCMDARLDPAKYAGLTKGGARDSKCWWTRKRRRHSLAHHQLQTARDARILCRSPH